MIKLVSAVRVYDLEKNVFFVMDRPSLLETI